MTMRIASYLRVSTKDQSIEPQRMEILAFCKSRNWPEPVEFSDVISGSTVSRSGLDAMMERIRKDEFDVVCVVKIDRLFRSLTHFALTMGEMTKKNVSFVSTSQGIDTSDDNPCGRLMRGLLSVIAEFERDLIRERTRAGLAVARANGKKLGKPSPVLPDMDGRRAIVAQWRLDGGRDYRGLGVLLGGVNSGTAFRVAKMFPAKAAPAVIDID